ncbi:phosphohydrolase [Halorubrum saccharovorum]|uniref:Phosphohydrolase n=1 Tax=Halorubrum saccharovorum TaxID=2248 RepID=A0A081EX58_9EURY|nr:MULTISPECIES: HD domain-containing protein [Halorubrum]KDS91996.1 phosphohydrolase [Halorubrum saccharovorum]
MVPVGVEIKETEVSDEDFEEMKGFVRDYLAASVESEEDGGRMRWYPWHSADYRFNHILNVVDLAVDIAESEGADIDVVRVAAVFHDVAKLEAEQDVHAEAGARVAREYLQSRGNYPESFIEEVCGAVVDHSYTGDLTDVSLESRCLMEADLLDKVGANGAVLMILRMGYESRTHMDSAKMVDRVLQRARDHTDRVVSDTAESIAHRRIKRVKWLREWLEEEVARMDAEGVTDR